MDFFKSMLSDDTEPEILDSYVKSETDPRPNQSPKHQEIEKAEEEYSNLNSTSSGEVGGGGGGLWSFGDLVKTLTTRSESVLEAYRRDLKEFGSGLRKESDLFREVASRAVKELPSSIEVGASAIDGVLKSTADIISQGKDALLEPSEVDDSDASEAVQNYSDCSSLNSRGYSRFDSQLNAIQSDTQTYCEDPEDFDDYNKWKSGFLLSDKKSDIEKLFGDNGSVEAIYRKVVRNEVDDAIFWCRYFYRVHKLKQQEDMRANLVRRSLAVDDEEELSWDVDDDDDDEEVDQLKPNTSNSNDLPEIQKKQSSNDESKTVSSHVMDDDLGKNANAASVNKNNADERKPSGGDVSEEKVESVPKSDENLHGNENAGKDGVDESKSGSSNVIDEDPEKKTNVASVDKNNAEEPKPTGGDVSDEKVELVPKTDENLDHTENSGKHGDVVAVSAQASLQEEDLEWDEIEDLVNNDEKRVSQGETPKKADLFKRLSTTEDDGDLSWDIEDDDEPVKTGSSK